MSDTNTVTITLDEYFDLRQKAEMNSFLMTELGRIQNKLHELEDRVWSCEDIVKRGVTHV